MAAELSHVFQSRIDNYRCCDCLQILMSHYFFVNKRCILAGNGDRGGTVVKVLCYKSECRCFDPRWCHWNFSLT